MLVGSRQGTYRRNGHTKTTVRVVFVAQQAFGAVLISLFLVGLASAALGSVWLISTLIFLFDPTIEDPGLIAEVPRRLLYPAPLVLLALLPSVQKTLERMGIHD